MKRQLFAHELMFGHIEGNDILWFPKGKPVLAMRKSRPKLAIVDPSEGWVEAARRVGEYPSPTDRSGKWVCFTNEQDAPLMWRLVAVATRAGLLGSFSDMAPARKGSDARVIEVHTYDWKDADDVRRVRGELRNIGYVKPIPYKTDIDTEAGIYKQTGFKRFSRYFE